MRGGERGGSSLLAFKALFQELLHYAGTPVKSRDELEHLARTANSLLTHHRPRFASPWDVAKMISSAIRCALRAQTSINLETLSVLGLKSCPAPACRTLVDLLRARQFDYPLAGLIDSLRREVQACTSPDSPSDAISVVLSLVNQWHLIKLRQVGAGEGFPVEQLSGFVGGLLSELAREGGATRSIASANNLFDTFSMSWMSNLMTFALQDSVRVQNALLVVSFLAEVLSSEVEKSSLGGFALSGLRSALVIGQWRRLRARILQYCRITLRNGRLKNQKMWADAVKEALTGAFAHEPPFLSEFFYLPPNFSATQCEALRKRVGESQEYSAEEDGEDSGGGFKGLLVLSRASKLLASCTGNQAYVEITDEDMPGVKTAIAFALHLRQFAIACELLAWAAAAGPPAHRFESLEWHHRLEVWGECREEISSWPSLPAPTRDSMLFTAYLAEVSPALSAAIALDALVASSDMVKLRVVCEGALCLGCRWGKAVLRDPFAMPFLVMALAKVAHESLNVGDAAMARMYVSLLGSCVAGGPTPDGLLLLLQVLARLAGGLGASSWPLAQPHDGGFRRWEDIRGALAALLPANPETTFRIHRTRWRRYRLGDAFNARRALFRAISHGRDGAPKSKTADPDSERRSDFTVVFVRCRFPPEGAGLTVERLRVEQSGVPGNLREGGSAPRMSYSVELKSALGAGEFANILKHLHAIFSENREQLRRGTVSTSGKTEIGRRPAESMASEHAATPPLPSSPLSNLPGSSENHTISQDTQSKDNPSEAKPNLTAGQRPSKEVWWGQRLNLDAQLAQAVRELEEGFGFARFLMIGELPGPLRLQLLPLSEQIVDRIAELRDSLSVDLPKRQKFSLLKQKCFVILQGLPFMAAEESIAVREPGEAEPSTSLKAAFPTRTAAYDPTHVADEDLPSPNPCCEDCIKFLHRTSAALFDMVVKLWMDDEGDAKGCAGVDVAVELEAWFVLHRERLQGICTQITQQVFDRMYGYLVDYYGSKGMKFNKTSGPHGAINQENHVSLLEVPREHLYIVVENDLHSLPLEGMDVLRDQSCSRVPSLEYLSQFELRGGTTPPEDCYSIDAVHFYIDLTAVASLDKFEALLRAHPEWSVDYGPSPFSLSSPVEGRNDAARVGSPSSPVLETLQCKGRSVYVYLGHKRGELELPRFQLYNRFPSSHFPDVLLMGCSSARMIGNAFFESYGMPWAYLHAGAKSFIGCLWDITNGEVDRLSRRFLRYSMSPQMEEVKCALSVGEALSAARKVCKLPFLSGVATVMYGVNRPFSSVNQT